MDLDITLELLEDWAVFYFEWTIEHLLVPGHVENWVVLLDLEDVGLTELKAEKL